MRVKQLTWTEIDRLVDGLASRLPPGSRCWGVPRGGSVVAAMLRSKHGVTITADSAEATIAVDDLIDSGRTARMVKEKYNLNLEPLLVKDNTDWIVFPWEGTELAEDAENTVTRMLQQIGEDPNRPELEDTPRQVVQCWDGLFSGYRYTDGDVAGLLASPAAIPDARESESHAQSNVGMLVIPGIPFISTCENHLLPFFGSADVACLEREATSPISLRGKGGACPELAGGVEAPPGLGNIPQVVDALARRLQTQQRLTEQICHALSRNTEGAGVRLRASFLCPMARGLADRETMVETSAFSGGFRPDPELQSRFLGQLS